jgi:glucoamylase
MNEAQTCEAPRSPGIEPRWTSSAKSGVGTALLACTRDLGLIVTGEHGFFSEEKRHAEHQIKSLASGIPAYDLVNTHAGHYRITKRIVSDPYRDVVLQRLTFEALSQTGGRYRVYALLAPHLVNAGASNTAWLGEYKGVPMLFAQGRGTALAMACTVPWRNASAGFVGYSDGWQMLSRNGKLDPIWTRAQNGNVALIGEIDFTQADEVTLALGFGQHPEEAAQWSTDGWRTTQDDPHTGHGTRRSRRRRTGPQRLLPAPPSSSRCSGPSISVGREPTSRLKIVARK